MENNYKYKKYYRAKEVAEYLGCGLSTIWYWSANKKLTPIKLSNRVTVFDIEEINKLFDEVER